MRVASPWKHPDTGIYYFRRGVPEALRPLVGKREEKVSLETRDWREAGPRYAAVAAEVSARWERLRQAAAPKPIVRLTHKEAVALAGEIYRRRVAAPASWHPGFARLASILSPTAPTHSGVPKLR
jgi:hypothetical protein